jgi:hypothetical protein
MIWEYNAEMGKDAQAGRLWRLSSMGFTFVSMIIAGGLLGWFLWWLIGAESSERTYIVSGAVIGIVYGMVDFIRDALRAVHEDQNHG